MSATIHSRTMHPRRSISCVAALAFAVACLFACPISGALTNAHAGPADSARPVAMPAAGLREQLEVVTGASSSAAHAALTATADEIFWDRFEQCGNGVIDPPEQCDRSDLGGATCQTQGFSGGTLGCDQSCHFDVSQCTASCPVALCSVDADCGLGLCGPCFEGICLGYTP